MKITITNKPSYAEEGQPNPLRWMMLNKEADGSFTNTTCWLKCKDFFNDYAYTVQTGKSFSIYGFNAGTLKPVKKGESVYMLLDVLSLPFRSNMDVLNTWLYQQKMPEIKWCDYNEKQVLIEIPGKYFENTYYISLISLIIRLMNYDKAFNTFDELIKYKEFPHGDQWKWDTVVQKGVYFNLPEKLRKYVWYTGEHSNEKPVDDYRISGVVHNNGVVSWSKAF